MNLCIRCTKLLDIKCYIKRTCDECIYYIGYQ